MAIFHCCVHNSKCANASYAYITGEKATDPITNKHSDYSSRKDVVYKNTILAEGAPQEWKGVKLWQQVALAEKLGGRQAKKIEVALPKEWELEEQVKICEEFAEDLRKQGHCITFAIHDKKDGNPHAHFLITLRQIENGNFKKTKSKKMYRLDENGERIPRIDKKTGKQKVDSRNRKQWLTYMVEDIPCSSKEWLRDIRQNWESTLNKHLADEQQVSSLSYEARGIEKKPTRHEGYGKKAEERKEYNLLIRAYNEVKEAIKASYKELKQILRGEEKEDDRREGSGTIIENKQAEQGDRQAEGREQRKRFDDLVTKLHNQRLRETVRKLDGFAGKGEEAEGLGKQAEQASRGTEQTRGQTGRPRKEAGRQGSETEQPRKGRSR